MGLTAEPIPRRELASKLDGFSTVILEPGGYADAARELEGWVRRGGTLIASRAVGLDRVLGIAPAAQVPQDQGEFSITGEISLADTRFTSGIRSRCHPDASLPVASAARLAAPTDSLPLAHSQGRAAITARSLDKGWAFYFAFDLAQTCWVIQQGRPVDEDYDGDGYWRTPDAAVTSAFEPEVPCTDELLFLLQNMLSVQPHPLIHQLPPEAGGVPDLLTFSGGDDEHDAGNHVPAAEFMASRGLPYHINCMPLDGGFALSPEEIARLRQLGTELSVHYNFMDGFQHPGGFTESDVASQTRQFSELFGQTPLSTVTHWCRWTGWAEPAIWMRAAGVRADNSFLHCRADVLNPVNRIGFAFGTSFPFFFWTDWRRQNSRLDFIELPITAYEVGYSDKQTDFPTLERAVELAQHYHSTMNFFYHPVYIANYPACRHAIDRLLGLLKEKGLRAVHTAPDALARWWRERSKSRIEHITWDGRKLCFRVTTPAPSGLIAKLPLPDGAEPDMALPHRTVEKFGRRWLMIVVPEGTTRVEVCLA
jgi:hypothetical protein